MMRRKNISSQWIGCAWPWLTSWNGTTGSGSLQSEKLCGIEDPAIREEYAKKLVQPGFETPLLLLGEAGDVQLLREMGIKLGHAIRLAQLLLKFVNDVSF